MSCSVGHRCGLEPTLLWLWCRPATTAPIQPLVWEPPYTTGAALNSKKEKKKKMTNPACVSPWPNPNKNTGFLSSGECPRYTTLHRCHHTSLLEGCHASGVTPPGRRISESCTQFPPDFFPFAHILSLWWTIALRTTQQREHAQTCHNNFEDRWF